MERRVVIGTAGHIDHGKTTLVRALTGVDTDRLAEEKARGITIDIGFAPLALREIAASVVDVPGHEGFIKNMVAGATGVDLALLVVAADEGVMPQTTEHLAILGFLGVARGVVALTKCDLAPDPAWRKLVADDVSDEIARLVNRRWPVVEVSAAQGLGLEALLEALAEEADVVAQRTADDRFRLPVDRVFSLPGAGTIVTGTVWSGTLAEGDRVTILPAGVAARARSIQVHGRPALRAEPGLRAALALAGLEREAAPRGAMVVSGDGWRASRALDVEVSLLPGVVLRSRERLRVHHGTAEVMARLARMDPAAAGATFSARLVLEKALVARAGDRVVLRSYSPVTTVGGARVLDPWADDVRIARGRASRGLPAAPRSDADRVRQLVARRGAPGLQRSALEVASGLGRARLDAALASASELGLAELDGWLVAAAEVDVVARRLQDALERYHAAHPLEPGMPAQAWRMAGSARRELVEMAEGRLLASGSGVVRDGVVMRLSGWIPGADRTTLAVQERVLAALREADAEPPSTSDLAATFPGVDVPAVLRLLVRKGEVVAVGRERYYEAGALERERGRLVAALRELGPATPAAIRERMQRSRKWLIPLLEWADREGLTDRQGDRRVLRARAGA
ncbi:MAG: selenocysteine-specific translation elongation factor [Gemmatimonadetes bacterium]|nr:selenocysteine-specific translation elongation factor [Gemmatimonadota bacterium]